MNKFAEIQEKRVLETFLSLVKIDSPTHDEREIADYLTNLLTELGGSVAEDTAGEVLGGNAGNLVANFPATEGMERFPVLMLTAHMDCVSPCAGVKPVVADGVIRSDGTTVLGSDDKAGITAIIEALRVLKEKSIPHGGLQVVFTISEENGVHGSEHLDTSLLQADFGYTFDTHGAPGGITFMAPGKNQMKITLRGKAAHAGVDPEKGINAICGAGRIIQNAPQGRIDCETTCNLGRITGGSATNIVADTCEIFYETRSRNAEKLIAITERIAEHFRKGAERENLQAEVEVAPDYMPYTLSKDAPVIEGARKAAEALGLPVYLEESGGGSDANHFNEYGIPTAVLSVGMTHAHTKEEYIHEADLYAAARWALAILCLG